MQSDRPDPEPGLEASLARMTMADYPAVHELWLATPGMGLNNLDDSAEGMARYLARNPQTCLVARAGQELLGVILAGHDGRRGFIYHLAVRPSARRRGIGTRLVAAALAGLKAEGITKVACVVFAGNTAGNSFWQAQGFGPRPDLCYRDCPIADREIIRIIPGQ